MLPGALLSWGADEKGEEASPTGKNYRKRLQRLYLGGNNKEVHRLIH